VMHHIHHEASPVHSSFMHACSLIHACLLFHRLSVHVSGAACMMCYAGGCTRTMPSSLAVTSLCRTNSARPRLLHCNRVMHAESSCLRSLAGEYTFSSYEQRSLQELICRVWVVTAWVVAESSCPVKYPAHEYQADAITAGP
jgi:hypothetical protein